MMKKQQQQHFSKAVFSAGNYNIAIIYVLVEDQMFQHEFRYTAHIPSAHGSTLQSRYQCKL